jgi:hypothetical protein
MLQELDVELRAHIALASIRILGQDFRVGRGTRGTARDVGDRVANRISQAKGRFPAETAAARPAGGSPTLLMENPTGPLPRGGKMTLRRSSRRVRASRGVTTGTLRACGVCLALRSLRCVSCI